LTFSDWFFGVDVAVNGWLFQPNTWLIERILDDFPWTLVHVNLGSYLLAVLVPISRIVFISMLVLFKLEKVDKTSFRVAGLIVLGISILECVMMMTINVIYGIPPGLYISIVRPDIDTRLFVPIPILLIVGFYLSRRTCVKMADSEVTGQEGLSHA